jgi:hypothetical protein
MSSLWISYLEDVLQVDGIGITLKRQTVSVCGVYQAFNPLSAINKTYD